VATSSKLLSKRYALQSQLGEGGMGVVWLAHDRKLNREVAIKLLRPEVAAMPDQRGRFEREASALAALEHDNIVRLYDYEESGDDAYLVMELINGESLAAAVSEGVPVGWEQTRSYAIPVCRALAYAHAHGVIHRDLTPANILLDSAHGRVFVSDFGLARIARSASTITSAGVLIGTPEYWSPEQATGADTDASTDMYALGCVLFWLLSGRLPFEGEDRLAIGLRRAHEAAPSLATVQPGLPSLAAETVDQLLRRDKADRPTAVTVLEALQPGGAAAAPTIEKCQPEPEEDSVDAPPPAPEPTLPAATIPLPREPAEAMPGRPRGRLVAILVVLVALVAAGAAIAVFRARQGSGPATNASSTRLMTMPRLIGMPLSNGLARLSQVASRSSFAGSPQPAISRVYSETAAKGVILRQQPAPRSRVSSLQTPISFVVSRGSAFAAVPAIRAGGDPGLAESTLNTTGFDTWRRFTPSWNIRKGQVVSITPQAGARVHRPAHVTILISSGYPKSTVPALSGSWLSDAESTLGNEHLHYTVVSASSSTVPAGRVMGQSPPSGSVMVQGHTVQITVARTPTWTRVFAQYGTATYQSPPFKVGQHWRIVYRCGITDPNSFSSVLTEFLWSSTDPLGPQDSFIANTAGLELHTYYPSSGAGAFQLQVNPFGAGTTWYFEVDSLQ
jgi:serine/threonine-protein kinase